MDALFKTDRSHSEVGDTLRYFNSVTSSQSWGGLGDFHDDLCCSGEELYFANEELDEDDGGVQFVAAVTAASSAAASASKSKPNKKQNKRRKSRAGSALQLLNLRSNSPLVSPPGNGKAASARKLRKNSIAGCYQVDRM